MYLCLGYKHRGLVLLLCDIPIELILLLTSNCLSVRLCVCVCVTDTRTCCAARTTVLTGRINKQNDPSVPNSVQRGRNIKLKSVTLQVKVIGPPPFSLIGFMRRRVVCSVRFAVDPVLLLLLRPVRYPHVCRVDTPVCQPCSTVIRALPGQRLPLSPTVQRLQAYAPVVVCHYLYVTKIISAQ